MTKQIFKNRWFVWALVAIVVAGFGVWGFVEYSAIKMESENTGNEITTIHPVVGSVCQKNGGIITDVTECDGLTKSQVCTFPDNTPCYVENIVNGKCTGSFNPKVLCDKQN